MTTRPVAVVTGSRRGIGRSIAVTLAAEGYDVTVADIEIDENAQVTVGEIESAGGKALTVEANMGDSKAADRLIADTVKHFGRIDVLVNNAAFWHWEGFLDVPEDHYDSMMDVDLKGPFLASQHAARKMIEQGTGGSVVNISSTHRERVWPRDTVYGIAKAGIFRLTQSMAYELGEHGIRVNAIAPGYIDSRTPKPGAPPPGEPGDTDKVTSCSPMRRVGVPQDIANAVAFLVSDKASFITGQCLTVDGGFMIGGTP